MTCAFPLSANIHSFKPIYAPTPFTMHIYNVGIYHIISIVFKSSPYISSTTCWQRERERNIVGFSKWDVPAGVKGDWPGKANEGCWWWRAIWCNLVNWNRERRNWVTLSFVQAFPMRINIRLFSVAMVEKGMLSSHKVGGTYRRGHFGGRQFTMKEKKDLVIKQHSTQNYQRGYRLSDRGCTPGNRVGILN